MRIVLTGASAGIGGYLAARLGERADEVLALSRTGKAKLAAGTGRGSLNAFDGLWGKLISAPWHPLDELPHRKAELMGSDIYTLRRVIPGDRGSTWG